MVFSKRGNRVPTGYTVQQHFCIVMILWIFESDHRSLLLNRYYYIEVSVCVCAVSCKLVT